MSFSDVSFVATLTIANGGQYSNVITRDAYHDAASLFFYNAAASQSAQAVTFQVSYEETPVTWYNYSTGGGTQAAIDIPDPGNAFAVPDLVAARAIRLAAASTIIGTVTVQVTKMDTI